MTLPAKRTPGDPQPGIKGSVRVAADTGRRQFVHVWTAPRSPAARVALAPLLIFATLLILAAGLVALIALVAVAFVIALFALLVRAPVEVVRGRPKA